MHVCTVMVAKQQNAFFSLWPLKGNTVDCTLMIETSLKMGVTACLWSVFINLLLLEIEYNIATNCLSKMK